MFSPTPDIAPVFSWTAFDARKLLPPRWDAQILTLAQAKARRRELVSTHSTSREGGAELSLPTAGVSGVVIDENLPWLRKLYESEFRALAQTTTDEPVSCMDDPAHGVVLNVQLGQTRYECHVDTNPIEGLLFVTTHREGGGGELRVSNRGDVHSTAEVDADVTVIEPKSGYLVFFDGRHHSHYVSELLTDDSVRVVVAMNYYVPSCPEQSRPDDLDRHLAGRPVDLPAH